MKQIKRLFAALVLVLTGGRILTTTAREELTARRAAWRDHAREIQAALDDERARGWGFRYCDGRRVDW